MPLERRAPSRVGPLITMLVIAVFVLSACGSSEDTGSTPTADPEPVSAAGSAGDSPNEAKPQGRETASTETGRGAKPRNARSGAQAPKPHDVDAPGKRGGGAQGEASAGIDRSAGSCPRSLTREQCLENARGSAGQAPSYPVDVPRDCLDAMSRADCEAMIERERAAQQASGPSFSPDECTQYYSREECEAVFEAMGQSPQ